MGMSGNFDSSYNSTKYNSIMTNGKIKQEMPHNLPIKSNATMVKVNKKEGEIEVPNFFISKNPKLSLINKVEPQYTYGKFSVSKKKTISKFPTPNEKLPEYN
jgi:hypothetical protein